jgi:hypothetical protein
LRFDLIGVQEFRINERHDLVPDERVVLDLVVGFIENSGEPAIVVALDFFGFVSHMKIVEDACSFGVLGNDQRPSWC